VGAGGGGRAAGGGVGALAGDRDHDGDRDRDDRLGDDRPGRSDEVGRDDAGRGAAAAGAGGAAGAALGGGFGRDRGDDDDDATGTPRHAATDDRSIAAENGPEHVEQTGSGERDEHGGQEAVKPGERTTRLRRYVVTERVVQTVEELPDEDDSSR